MATITHKLDFLLEQVLGSILDQDDIQSLRRDLLVLRDATAGRVDSDRQAFLARFIEVMDLSLAIFRFGTVPTGAPLYTPISDRPITQAVASPDFPKDAFGRFGVALALVGRGHAAGDWSVVPGDRGAPDAGVLRLVTPKRQMRVFFVKDTATWTTLDLGNTVNTQDPNVLVVVADEVPKPTARSPRSRLGGNGRVSGEHFSIAKGLAESISSDELYEAFKLAGGF